MEIRTMNPRISGRQKNVLFCSMCCLVYFTSYITRINYGAAIAEIIDSLGTTKILASMAVTGSFVTYGAGQIISGIIGDHVKPRTMIFCGLFVTSICNIILSGLSNVYIMTAVWCLNGFAQSMMWPPLARILAENLSPDNYKKACVAVSASASAATIAIYMIVPLCITLSGWRSVFLISAFWGFAMSFLWLFTINRFMPTSSADSQETAIKPDSPVLSFRWLLFHSGLIPIMVIILLQGFLRDGITTWMPSYINDVYRFGTSISILSAAILPIFAIISVFAASYVHKSVKSEVKASAYIWILGLICSFVLILVFSSQAILSITMMAIITGCMHGINIMLISILPARYKNTGRVSTVSGILNAFTYAGSAISTYGIAALSDKYGWRTTIVAWCIIALGGAILNLNVLKGDDGLSSLQN